METADQRKTETAPLSQEKLSEYRKYDRRWLVSFAYANC